MSDEPIIKPDAQTRQRQSEATDPAHSAWVSAHAGSGKTFVLAIRVIRLLLDGARPSQLLCLTFTRAAAAEMSNRVFKILGKWATMGDRQLRDEITDITGAPPSAGQMTRARQLFALALDTPGGLKIQTIHAFCDALLHQFPLEANVPGHFEQADEYLQSELMEEARRRVVLASLGIGPSGTADAEKLAKAFETIRDHASASAVEKALDEIIKRRVEIGRWLKDQPVEAAFEPVWRQACLSRSDDGEALFTGFAADTFFDEDAIAELVCALESATAKSAPNLIDAFGQMQAMADPQEQHTARCRIFLKADENPRQFFISHNFTDSVDGLRERFEQEQGILIDHLDKLKMLNALKASEALFTVGSAMLGEYARLKLSRGLLDFDDLISRAATLLCREDIGAWVQYKLDRGISHVLVDEAQDTSPRQWEIINAITAEFFAGKGAVEETRTLFVVGDEKQSIFSFQGADPAEFGRQREELRRNAKNAGLAFKPVGLELSFRSTDEVLSAVDQVFSLDENSRGLSSEELKPHSAYRKTHRGEVIIWPLEPKHTKPEKTDWLTPPDEGDPADAEVKLAVRIASTIENWLKNSEKLPGHNRLLEAGDILILVRKRDKFAAAITRELKRRNLKSAGADRLRLAEHIAAEDMLALGRFVLMTSDDLALAGLLKSPLFEFSEDELYHLAHGRKAATLYDEMGDVRRRWEQGEKNCDLVKKAAHAHTVLSGLVEAALRMPVFEFYASVFARQELRRKYLEHLGGEVEDVIDGFLRQAIEHDNRTSPGLQGFVEWLAGAGAELKREVDMKTDEIRVITVHSAKGLEAPVVFLVDPGSAAFSTRHAPKLVPVEGTPVLLWQAGKASRVSATEAVFSRIESEAEEEYRRLLYVGMTRAADRLIVCGYAKETAKHTHWHKMVMAGLRAEPADPRLGGGLVEEKDAEGNPLCWRWLIDRPTGDVALEESDKAQPEQMAVTQIPGRAQAELRPPAPLSPSGVLQLFEVEDRAAPAIQPDALTLARGNATHQLLQILPDLEPGERQGAITRYFDGPGADFPNALREEITTNVIALLDHPQMQPLLAEGSQAEVALAGRIEIAEKSYMVRGQADRMVIGEREIIVADYKTGRNAPATADAAPAAYLVQLALYRELLMKIYPGRPVQAVLVWTDAPVVMAVPLALLEKQMQQLNDCGKRELDAQAATT